MFQACSSFQFLFWYAVYTILILMCVTSVLIAVFRSQDPSNKKMIVCDEQLQDLFDCDHFVGFDLTKLLTRHFIKPELQ